MTASEKTKKFILEAKDKWGDRWDYSLTVITNKKKKSTFICPEHGSFDQTGESHLAIKVGCRGCYSTKRDLSWLESESKKLWGDRWDYSKSEYVNYDTPIVFRCKEHDVEFLQKPGNHLRGQEGCYKCHGLRSTHEDFIAKATDVWGDSKDFSKSNYVNSYSDVVVTCNIHDYEYTQRASSVLRGLEGCMKCSGSKHGEFSQPAETHLLGRVGCGSCSVTGTSAGEIELRTFIESLGFSTVNNTRRAIPGENIEVDIFVPSKNIALEYNEVYYHSSKFKDRDFHHIKWMKANAGGVRLVQVWEDDWVNRTEIVKENVRQVLGVSSLEKVSARKTNIKTLSTSVARTFLERYHIQGHVNSSVYLGLEHEGELVAVATFKKDKDNYYLTRYATSKQVRGGHSKLISFFERNYRYSKLITFADLNLSDGSLYRKTGWIEEVIIPPDYQYLINGNREHKFNYRKSRFKTDPNLEFDPSLTESELASLNGIYKVYDAGKIRFIKHRPNGM